MSEATKPNHHHGPSLDFGEPLGSYHGVVAYSNLDDTFFSGEKNYMQGLHTGYKYQCVEFARRFLLSVKACQFGQCNRASEIFSMTTVQNVEDGSTHPFVACANGKSTEKPLPGCVFLYPYDENLTPWGHVAIISAVGDDWVGIAEQNQENFSWGNACYGRKIPLSQDPDTKFWTITETDPQLVQPLGWMMTPTVPDRPNPRLPLKPLPELLAKYEPCWFTRRRLMKLTEEERTERKEWPISTMPRPTAAAEAAYFDYMLQHHPATLQNWNTILYPNERSGVGCIGALNASFRAIGKALTLLIGERSGFPAGGDDAQFYDYVAQRYQMPRALASTLCTSSLSAASIHSSFVTMMTLGFIKINSESDAPITMIDANLDDLDGIVEASCFQGPIADHNGHAEGWSPSIEKDCARFVATRLAHHQPPEAHHSHGTDSTGAQSNASKKGPEAHLYFVDLGASSVNPIIAEALPNAEDRDAYDRYRLTAHVLVELIQKSESQKDFVHIVAAEDLATAPCGGLISKKHGGERVVHLHKMCSWAHLFAIATHAPIVQEVLLDSQVRGHVNVHPPLFTHITASPLFLRDARTALEAQRAKLNEESEACELLLEALRIWPSTETIAAAEEKDVCRMLTRMEVNRLKKPVSMDSNDSTKEKEEDEATEGAEGEGADQTKVVDARPGGGAAVIHVKVRAIAVSGYWSTGCYMEKRIGKYSKSPRPTKEVGGEEAEEEVLEDVTGESWNPASFKYLFHKRRFLREELDD